MPYDRDFFPSLSWYLSETVEPFGPFALLPSALPDNHTSTPPLLSLYPPPPRYLSRARSPPCKTSSIAHHAALQHRQRIAAASLAPLMATPLPPARRVPPRLPEISPPRRTRPPKHPPSGPLSIKNTPCGSAQVNSPPPSFMGSLHPFLCGVWFCAAPCAVAASRSPAVSPLLVFSRPWAPRLRSLSCSPPRCVLRRQ